MSLSLICRTAALAWGALFVCGSAAAQLAEFYVGVDGRTEAFDAAPDDGGGTYPDNPNHGRLTFLYNHGNHFHGLGAYRYVGPADDPTLEDTNANNRVPEGYTLQEPLPLLPGEGLYAGANATAPIPGVDYSNLELRNVHSLDGVDQVLYESSGERWNTPFDDADVHLELLSVSSPHLRVGSTSDPDALAVGGDVHLGEGDEFFSFTPVLWVEESAPAGEYWAEFQLVDASGAFGDSGRFFVDVVNVPEPASAAVLLGAALVASACCRRRC